VSGNRGGHDLLRGVRLVLFDLDGTLVHSLPDLALSIDQMLVGLEMPACGEAAVSTWLGDGIDTLVERALLNGSGGEPDAALFDRARQLFMQRYSTNNGRLSRPYAGTRPLLAVLRAADLQLGCVTNKSQVFTGALLQQLDLASSFDCVISGDQVSHKKPHPEPLLVACRQTDVPVSAALLVGDSGNDVRAARAAGMPVVCVSYGYNRGEDIRSAQPDVVVDDLSEVAALLGFS
jgi:phosphoglycolate phosphatase